MIVDIGGGTTEVAVISLGGIVASQSVRVGGDELDDAIIQFIKKEYCLALGERTAEEVKMASARRGRSKQELHAEIRGRDLVTGLPKTIVDLDRGDPRGDRTSRSSAIVDAVKVDARQDAARARGRHHGAGHRARRWRRAPATVSTPGSSHETGMPIVIAANPLHSVAIGSGQSLEEFEALKGVLFSAAQR